MKTLIRMALVTSLMALGAASLEAADITDPGVKGVRVVNNYLDMVRVYAEDSQGHLHKLGRVMRGELVEFEIPEAIASTPFRIKVYPSQPVWSMQLDDYGVKTNPLSLHGGDDVTVWLEPDLKRSVVEMSRG